MYCFRAKRVKFHFILYERGNEASTEQQDMFSSYKVESSTQTNIQDVAFRGNGNGVGTDEGQLAVFSPFPNKSHIERYIVTVEAWSIDRFENLVR